MVCRHDDRANKFVFILLLLRMAVLIGSNKNKLKKDGNELWEDREVRFDVPITYVNN